MMWFDVEGNTETEAGNSGITAKIQQTQNAAFPLKSLFPFGFFSKPTKKTRGVAKSVNNNESVALGYLQKAGEVKEIGDGESMVYSKNDDGVIQAKIVLRKDGNIEIIKAKKITIKEMDVEIIGGTCDISGKTDVTIQGVGFLGHTHDAGVALLDSMSGKVTGTTGGVFVLKPETE
jgi:hypothetical protein